MESILWRDVFPKHYLKEANLEIRVQEFLATLTGNGTYYIIKEANEEIGVAKTLGDSRYLEISSLYILDQYYNKGDDKKVIMYLKRLS